MKTVKLNFENENGEKLAARLEMPVDNKPKVFAIFAHCFTCNKNYHAVVNISRALTQNSIAVLRFDFTGLGESEGDFADTNFSSNTEDLITAAKYLGKEYEAPQILIGHSLGGAAVLRAALELEDVKAVVTVGAPSNPEHVLRHIEASKQEIEEKGEAEVEIGQRPFKIKKQFIDDLESKNMERTIEKLRRALLILHSPQDKVVGINNAAQIYKAARHPKSFITLDDADHLLTDKKDSLYAGNIIASWVGRYVDLTEAEGDLHTEQQVVVRTGAKGYTTEVRTGRHSLLADEPESVGGNNLGPTPYDYLAVSLATCTSMTLRMYADRKEWDLQEVRVHVNHEKVHKEDCDDCEGKDKKIDRLERLVELEGDLDDKQKERLIEIANKCPVHRTLHGEIKVTTELKE